MNTESYIYPTEATYMTMFGHIYMTVYKMRYVRIL